MGAARGLNYRMTKFCRYELRTTDDAAAREFYAAIFGHDRAVIWRLHEEALARGAKPHWLGSLPVPHPELVTKQFIERGAAPLGPARTTERGFVAVLRDPGGAIVAICSPPPTEVEPPVQVVFHALNTNDVARAKANYRELLGWGFGRVVDLGEQGTFQQFAWHDGGEVVGALGDVAGRPHVHTQWLFFFAVDSLDLAIEKTRAAGGVALTPMTLPSGVRCCVCDDPQGATFGIQERR